MRKIQLSTLVLLCLLGCGVAVAQKAKETATRYRCGTEAAIEQRFKEDPAFREEYLRKNAATTDGSTSRGNGTARVTTLTSPVVIPVIVHVVLPNPNIITEEQIDYLLNRLNLDYSGLNPDSTNGNLFYNVRGHSLIRFTRARRTPAGQITNGIERRVGAGAIAQTTYQAIKHASAGGLDPWDVTQYYNMWVGDGSATGLLGIAPGIGVGGQTETTTSATGIDGVCVDYSAFSNGCFSIPAYNLGRTVVHEIGHNFGLYHIFTGCAAGADFAQPTPAGQTLPATLVGATGDDTPGQSAATTNCPTGAVASNCTGVPNPPGKMYQNYMDYTADACYSMFTKNQVERMHYMLETYRPGYLTTQGAVPPASFPAVDAGLNAIVNPGGAEFNNTTCSITNYPVPSCAGSFVPRVAVTNYGSSTLTSITATVTVNGVTSAPATFTVNLITNRTTTLVFPAQTLVTGSNTISFTITSANGSADTYTTNNTISTTVNIASPSVLPFTQDFTSTTFPPANMTIVNPNGNNTWERRAAGNGNAGSAFIDNYNNNFPGQTDDIRTIPLTPPVNPTSQDSVIITFDVAHKNYPGSFDVLNVLVSTNCGTSFTSVYNKSGATLATAGSSTANYTAPAASDWRRERIAIGGSFLTGNSLIVAFRNTNDYGNNIFIDNINIYRKLARDIRVSAILSPGSYICNNTLTPQVTVNNLGAETVTSFTVNYRINNGTVVSQTYNQSIASGASVNVTLPVSTVTSSGNNTFTAFTSSPVTSSGTGDLLPSNDTLSQSFIVPSSLPLVEGFENATFPPAGWSLINPDADVTWVRDNHGRNSLWSAKFDNYNNDVTGTNDALQTPPIRTTNLDSIIVTFDVAHRDYTGSADVLQVLGSANCGTSFTSFYNKSGSALATAGSSTADYVNPAQSHWRTERVSIPVRSNTLGSEIIRFQNTNDYGNNIFIDNINITGIYRKDLQLLSINQPSNIICSTANTPSITVRNAGVDTITGFKAAYVIDNAAPVVSTFSNLALPGNATQIVSLTAATFPSLGAHTFRVYIYDVVSSTGVGEPNPANDTLTKAVSVVGSQAAPLAEGFDSPTFPPTGWAVNNPDGLLTWQRTTLAARTGSASAYTNNYNYSNAGSRDELYTPRVTYTGVDSVSLTFDVAATTYSYPGSTEIPLDTLEVLVTTDCGATLRSVYKKWGNQLQTVSDPNSPQTTEFIPSGTSQWRREQIDLTGFVANSPIQVVFRNTTNYENNIFIDNVNLNTKTLPAKLKEQGYLIYPSPFTSSFTIQHYLPPTELRSMAVYNSIGQRVVAQSFGTTGATSMIQVNMSRFAPGLYTVVLEYANRTVSQKIIKAQ